MEEVVMQSILMLIAYVVVFASQVILFVYAVRRKTKKLWGIVFSSELFPMVIAICLMIYYNNLPGYGFMPGLAYIGEVLFSFGAAILYCVGFLISFCVYLVTSRKHH